MKVQQIKATKITVRGRPVLVIFGDTATFGSETFGTLMERSHLVPVWWRNNVPLRTSEGRSLLVIFWWNCNVIKITFGTYLQRSHLVFVWWHNNVLLRTLEECSHLVIFWWNCNVTKITFGTCRQRSHLVPCWSCDNVPLGTHGEHFFCWHCTKSPNFSARKSLLHGYTCVYSAAGKRVCICVHCRGCIASVHRCF